MSAVSETGRVSFLSTYDPRPDEFSDDIHPRITEEFFESEEGDKYRENDFRVGNPHLTGQHLGKYLRAHAIALQERRKACASILQLVKQHSTLSSAIEGATRTHDPNAVLRAVELFYNSKTFSTCLAILSTFNQQKDFVSKDNLSQGLNVMRAYRVVTEQFFSIFDDKDRRKKYKEIWDLLHFCDMILLLEKSCGHDRITIPFIHQHVRCFEGDLLRFDIDLFKARYGDHLSAMKKFEDKTNKKNDVSPKIPQIKAIAWLKDPRISKEKWKVAVNILRLSENSFKRIRDAKESPKPRKQLKGTGVCFNFQRAGSCKYGE